MKIVRHIPHDEVKAKRRSGTVDIPRVPLRA